MTTLSSGLVSSHISLVETGKRLAERAARTNPLVEPAKNFDLAAVDAILQRDEYKALLAEPNGLAFLLCRVASHVEITKDLAYRKKLSEIKDVASKIIAELAEPLRKRRKTAEVGGKKSGETRKRSSKEALVIREYAKLAAAGRPKRDRAALIADRVGITAERVRQIIRENKTETN
ncbi:hypothetical protein A6V37_22020 [Paraburkholderia ginsengiterrae]|nr:hypothetical protein A6V37_22020 [Paraburkholderia ginsengiterrae]